MRWWFYQLFGLFSAVSGVGLALDQYPSSGVAVMLLGLFILFAALIGEDR